MGTFTHVDTYSSLSKFTYIYQLLPVGVTWLDNPSLLIGHQTGHPKWKRQVEDNIWKPMALPLVSPFPTSIDLSRVTGTATATSSWIRPHVSQFCAGDVLGKTAWMC